MSQDPEIMPPAHEESNSAESASINYRLPVPGAPDIIKKKCDKCKTVTVHEWVKLIPVPHGNGDGDPMKLLELAKRVTICCNCGNIRVTN